MVQGIGKEIGDAIGCLLRLVGCLALLVVALGAALWYVLSTATWG